jgi:DNA-binding transcriptional LysR family regulator
MRPIPPMKALVALEAAMRLGRFTLAAEELSVTPGAVGQQIQKLEACLGVALFGWQHLQRDRLRSLRDGRPGSSRVRGIGQGWPEAVLQLAHF